MLSFIGRNWKELAVGLFITAIVAAVLMPTGCGSRESARRISCVNNLKQIGTALSQYAQEYDEIFPPLESRTRNGQVVTWRNAIQPFLNDVNLWKCPSNDASKMDALDGLPMGYETTDVGPIRRYGLELSKVFAPTKTILAFEENAIDESAKSNGVSWNNDDGSDASLNVLYAGHLGTGNFLFVDGHVKSMRSMATVGANGNMWHVDTTAKVSPRAMAKLKAATKTFE